MHSKTFSGFTLCVCFCAILLFGGARSSVFAEPPSASYVPPERVNAPQWEYLRKYERELVNEGADSKQSKQPYNEALSAALSARGLEGWELVSVVVAPTRVNPNNTVDNEIHYIFKRPNQRP